MVGVRGYPRRAAPWACLDSSSATPYPLHRQKAFLVPGIVPDHLLDKLREIPTWDSWDPDRDRWYFDPETHDYGDNPDEPHRPFG